MTVTLETLRAEYEAAREAHLNEDSGIYVGKTLADVFPDLREHTIHDWSSFDPAIGWRSADLILLARQVVLYEIARDYGKPAAMLYKLSDGAIDPREEDA